MTALTGQVVVGSVDVDLVVDVALAWRFEKAS